MAADVPAQIRGLKGRNKVIQAIRLMRAHTGMSLRDAKNAVDRL